MKLKKTIFLLLAVVALSSCSSYDDETQIKTVYLTVRQSDWTENINTSTDAPVTKRYYSASFTMPEITSNVTENGLVQVYTYDGSVQEVLPYVRHYGDSSDALWTRTVDYDFSNGNLTIYVTDSDFAADLPGSMDFRVVILQP